MLHEKSVQYNSPDGTGTGADADAGSGDWTGGKRRKHFDPSLHSEVRTSSSDSPPAQGGQEEPLLTSADMEDSPSAQGDQEDPFLTSVDMEDSPPAQGDQEDPFFTAVDLEHFIISLDEELKIGRFNKKKAEVFVDYRLILDYESQRHVYERLVLYRLKAHKLSKGESIDKLDDETLKTEFSDFPFPVKETESIFQLHDDVDNYFESLEEKEGGSVGWYFDPKFSMLKDLADYQRLVLKNHNDVEYLNYLGCRCIFSTYNMDKDYVNFCTEISEKLKWVKTYIGTKGTCEWLEIETRGCKQALKLATKYSGVTNDLVIIAYAEHIWSLHNDYLYCEDWDIIFLQIWKLVIKKQWDFTRALMQVQKKKYVARHDLTLVRFLSYETADLKSKFDFCVKGIPHDAKDVAAKNFIKKRILKLPRKKTRQQYLVKKMEIAESIGLHKEECGQPTMMIYDNVDFMRQAELRRQLV